jgi:uncharacterized membrane protein YfcA
VHEGLSGAVIAFLVAIVTTPAGVSGAVFLLPVEVSVLHVPNPAVTPTNLLYNVLSTPGALLRLRRDRRLVSPLTRALLTGAVPGVLIGAVVRVEVLSGPRIFLLVVAAVLAPLGVLLITGQSSGARSHRTRPGPAISALAFGAGVIGGIYGIGGGSLLGPLLAYMGFSVYAIAPAALTSTFVTSVAGVLAYQTLELTKGGGAIAPEWILGLSMGAGGLGGSYLGARLQRHISETALRRLLGVICLALAARYTFQGIA